MTAYVTHYTTDKGESFYTMVYAKDWLELQRLIKERGLNEFDPQPAAKYMRRGLNALFAPIAPPVAPSEWFKMGRYDQALHALIYLGAIVAKTHPEQLWGLLNDTGIIHEVAHINRGSKDVDNRSPKLLQEIEAFEQSIPGFLPRTKEDEADREEFITATLAPVPGGFSVPKDDRPHNVEP